MSTIARMIKQNPEYFRWLALEAIELKEKYGKYRVLWAVEQMEKKYDIRK